MQNFKLKSHVKDFVAIANKSMIREVGIARVEEVGRYFDSEEVARQ